MLSTQPDWNPSSAAALGSDTGGCQLNARLFYDRKEFPRILNNDFRLVGLQGLGLHQFSADPQRGSARFDKFCRSVQIDAAGRNQWNLRQRALQSFDVLCSTYLATWENLDEVRAGIPGSNHFRRRQRPGHDQLPFPYRKLDGLEVQPRTHQKLCPGIQALARRLRIEHGSGADEDLGRAVLHQLANYVHGTGHSHGDFHDGNAALTDGIGRDTCFSCRRRTNDRHESNLDDAIANLLFIHWRSPSSGATSSTRDARPNSLHHLQNFLHGGHRSVARRGHGERTVRGATFHRPLRILSRQESVNQAGSKGIASSYAVENFKTLTVS